MGVQKPQQAQEPDQYYLADDWVAVDQEGNGTANNGRFDQIKNAHTIAFKLCPGSRLLCVRPIHNAAV